MSAIVFVLSAEDDDWHTFCSLIFLRIRVSNCALDFFLILCFSTADK